MNNGVQKIIKNVLILFVIDFIALPAGIALYAFHGFHIVHVVLAVAYLAGLVIVYDTAVLATKHIRLVNETQVETTSDDDLIEDSDFCCQDNYDGEECDCGTDESLKPEMKQAMDDVFGIKH